jgi:hypothetical protein
VSNFWGAVQFWRSLFSISIKLIEYFISYLKSHNSFLGLKQDRFSILLSNGEIDYTVETVNGLQVKKKKVNRPKALCFDYLILKDAFGIDLETETIEGNDAGA